MAGPSAHRLAMSRGHREPCTYGAAFRSAHASNGGFRGVDGTAGCSARQRREDPMDSLFSHSSFSSNLHIPATPHEATFLLDASEEE
jgi:hypothetical protein